MTPVLIAGTFQQAKRWAEANQTSFTYISNPGSLRLLPKGSKVLRLGTWHKRADLQSIIGECELRGLEIVDVADSKATVTDLSEDF